MSQQSNANIVSLSAPGFAQHYVQMYKIKKNAPTVYNTRCSWHAIQGHTVTHNKPGYSGVKQDRPNGVIQLLSKTVGKCHTWHTQVLCNGFQLNVTDA